MYCNIIAPFRMVNHQYNIKKKSTDLNVLDCIHIRKEQRDK